MYSIHGSKWSLVPFSDSRSIDRICFSHTPTNVDLNKLPKIERLMIKLDRLIGKGAFGTCLSFADPLTISSWCLFQEKFMPGRWRTLNLWQSKSVSQPWTIVLTDSRVPFFFCRPCSAQLRSPNVWISSKKPSSWINSTMIISFAYWAFVFITIINLNFSFSNSWNRAISRTISDVQGPTKIMISVDCPTKIVWISLDR